MLSSFKRTERWITLQGSNLEKVSRVRIPDSLLTSMGFISEHIWYIHVLV